MMDIARVTSGQMYRYYLRQVVVGDGRRPARTSLRAAQQEAGVPAGRWMGRGLAVLGLEAGEVVTEAQLRNLFGEGRHPYADQIEAGQLAAGKKPAAGRRAGALGRRVKVTGVDLVFRPQPTLTLLWALGDEETRQVVEAAHERAIAAVLAWIEDEVAVIRFGAGGPYRVRPVHGLVAARFRHYESRSGTPLLHDHLLLSVKAQRPGKDKGGKGIWGSVHTEALYENAVAASALYNELVAAEACEALGLATEPRTVTPGRRPVMEIAGVPHELIRWTARRGEQITACLTELEHEYVTAVDDDGEVKFLPVVSERARMKLNRIAARKTRPPKRKAQPLPHLRASWKANAIHASGVAAHAIDSLLARARGAARAIRSRVAAAVDVALAAVDVTAMVFVMNGGGRFHRRHLLAEARRHLAFVLRGRRRDPGLDEQIVDAALAAHCLDISTPKTLRGRMAAYHLYTARWSLPDLAPAPRPAAVVPDPDRHLPAGPGAPAAHRPPGREPGEWEIPRVPLRYDRAVLAGAVVRAKLRVTTATTVRGRAYDVHAQEEEDPHPQEPRRGVDLGALRTDLEALELTADRMENLRRAGQAFTAAAEASETRQRQHTSTDSTANPTPHTVRPPDGQQSRDRAARPTHG